MESSSASSSSLTNSGSQLRKQNSARSNASRTNSQLLERALNDASNTCGLSRCAACRQVGRVTVG